MIVSSEDNQRCLMGYEIIGLINEHGDYYIVRWMWFDELVKDARWIIVNLGLVGEHVDYYIDG